MSWKKKKARQRKADEKERERIQQVERYQRQLYDKRKQEFPVIKRAKTRAKPVGDKTESHGPVRVIYSRRLGIDNRGSDDYEW